MTRLFDRLGIKIDLEPKLTLVRTPTAVTEQVASGNSEIGLTYVNVIVADPGVESGRTTAGRALAPNTPDFHGRKASASQELTAVDAFVGFLSSPKAAAIFRSKGFEQD